MFTTQIGEYHLTVSEKKPLIYDTYCKHAQLIEKYSSEDNYLSRLYVMVSRNGSLPFLIVEQEYSPGPESGFTPGILLIPETKTLFIGAGERLLAYMLEPLQRLWEDEADTGFWGWERYQEYVIMAAELELAVWDITGKKLWSMFVEPPWYYKLEDDMLHLDIMDTKFSFSLREGPPSENWDWRKASSV